MSLGAELPKANSMLPLLLLLWVYNLDSLSLFRARIASLRPCSDFSMSRRLSSTAMRRSMSLLLSSSMCLLPSPLLRLLNVPSPLLNRHAPVHVFAPQLVDVSPPFAPAPTSQCPVASPQPPCAGPCLCSSARRCVSSAPPPAAPGTSVLAERAASALPVCASSLPLVHLGFSSPSPPSPFL